MNTRAKASAAVLVPLVFAAGSVAVAAQPASAAPAVRILKIQYDSPGSDTGSNTSLNGEWVVLKNFSSTNRSR